MSNEHMVKYGEHDPIVWCKCCKALFRCDPMDSACRMCGHFNSLSEVTDKKTITWFENISEERI